MTEQQQSHFEGWAIVEQMGHNRYAGFVTTEAFGQAVLFRIDVPALEQRERIARRPEYVANQYCPAGTTVQESAVQGYTKYIGPGSLFALTPCSQEACLKAVEEIQPRTQMILRLPAETQALAAAALVDKVNKPCGCSEIESCIECRPDDDQE